MAKFTSEFRGLLLQDDDGVWARFEDGVFETDDKAVAARLRKVEYVSEVDAKPAAKKAAAPEGK